MEATQASVERPGLIRRTALWTSRAALVAWAGFWMYFVIAAGSSDIRAGLANTAPIMAAFLVSLTALLVIPWRWPRLGGLLLIASGIGAAIYFRYPGVEWLIALPPVLIGAVSIFAGSRKRRAGGMGH